jgi:predicted Zn-dependent protease with MMP-like domain
MERQQVTKGEFEAWVAEAWEQLPERFRERVANVAVVVEEWPGPDVLRRKGIRNPAGVLGFYYGVPLSRRGRGYNLKLPDKIYLYRRPILMHARSREAVPALIGRVLRHEIAHYFGMDDEHLKRIGAY